MINPTGTIHWLTGTTMHKAAVDLMNRHLVDWRMSGVGDALRRNAVVDDNLIITLAVNMDVIDDRGVVVNLRRLRRRGAIIMRVRIAEIGRRHKREAACTQPETEAHVHAVALINNAHAGLAGGIGGQRSPAAVSV